MSCSPFHAGWVKKLLISVLKVRKLGISVLVSGAIELDVEDARG